MKILDLYKSILQTAGLVVTSDGFIKMKIGDSTKPATIKGKSLVLPTDEHLKNPDWEKRVVFHPLFENVMRPESDVLGLYRQAANIRINVSVGVLATFLMRLATSPVDHNKLNPDQSEFLSKVKNADDKTLQALKKLMEAAPVSQPQKSFVHLYLKKTGTAGGKRFARVGVVSFPLYAELKKAGKDHEVFGVKLRVKDRDTLIALFEFMFPGIDEVDCYNRGSNSEVAPSIDAMMKVIAAIADPINGLVELFRSALGEEEADELLFNSDWADSFENLAIMLPQVRSIPMQAGNDGAVKPAPEQPAAVAQPQFATAPGAPQAQQAWGSPLMGQMSPAPVEISKGGVVNLDAALRANPALNMAAMQRVGSFTSIPGAGPVVQGGTIGQLPQNPMQFQQFQQAPQPLTYHNQGQQTGQFQQFQQMQPMQGLQPTFAPPRPSFGRF